MTWVAWRLHRAEGAVVLAVLAVLGAFLLLSGLPMAHSYQQSGLAACLAHATDSTVRGTCGQVGGAFQNQFGYLLPYAAFALLALPVLLGALVGAPLVARELEQRTHLLVWMQSVTRVRWLSVTVGLVLGGGLLAGGVALALMRWWYSPFAQLLGTFRPPAYDFSGPVLPASAVLALALGIAAGALTRRTVLAIFLTLLLVLAIRMPVELFLRPNFAPPVAVTWPIARGDNPPVTVSTHVWEVDSGWIDGQGHQTHGFRCSSPSQTSLQCMQADGYRSYYFTYQPADRFWTFQWTESGIYLGLSALAVGLTYWLVRRRVT